MQKTFTMRKKEGLADYRYFPELDLPEVILTKDYVDKIQQVLPELSQKQNADDMKNWVSTCKMFSFLPMTIM